jgi:type I restriction enzyme S subunit
MNDWRRVMLGDLIDVKHGYAFKGQYFATEGEELVLTPGNFPVGGGMRFRPGKDRYYSGSYPPEFRLTRGDLLVVMTDLTQNAPILGSPAFVPGEPVILHNQRLGLVTTKPGSDLDRRFLYYLLLSDSTRAQLRATATGTTVRHTAPERIYRVSVDLPPVSIQRIIGATLGSIDDLIENNRRRVELLEEIARTTYREWFVYFRYPNHTTVKFVESQLGRIPEGWEVTTVSGLASSERNAVTGGPFGSKLGRKDYVDRGIPVIRGTNLRLGGGFDESDLVFVSEKKAAELRSSIAIPGDVVVTQRGTLGQIGLIPMDAAFDRYLLSQSQMKITIDPIKTNPQFVYSQMRSPETTERFIARAMSSGVPHVNLELLRGFKLINPPYDLQMRYSDHVRTLDSQGWVLRRQTDRLRTLRDRLLPRLVTGQIDVSSLDVDAVVEESAA